MTDQTLQTQAKREAERAAAKYVEWRDRRNDAIVAMNDAGFTLKQIAKAVQLSDMGVLRILRQKGSKP
jgi:hypothetical protein